MREGLWGGKEGYGGCRDTRWKRLRVASVSDCVQREREKCACELCIRPPKPVAHFQLCCTTLNKSGDVIDFTYPNQQWRLLTRPRKSFSLSGLIRCWKCAFVWVWPAVWGNYWAFKNKHVEKLVCFGLYKGKVHFHQPHTFKPLNQGI